ncbi:MAG: hypothetical protein QNJ41_17975 [Xenococcaceae cyanobacterium MO_188.B32]|nr:hypothetical protein [Xenococcaceae cyanobacterium MO_188.B32]
MTNVNETNQRLDSFQSTIENQALLQTEQAIRASIGEPIKQIAKSSVTQNAIAITEAGVREAIQQGVSEALSELGALLSTIQQETTDRFACSVTETQLKYSRQTEFQLPTIQIETKSLNQSLSELSDKEYGIAIQYESDLKKIEQSQGDELPDLF